jgi:hypothetical protein
MSRQSRQIRLEHEERWPRLYQFLAAYLHQDWPVMYRSQWAAVEHAIADYDLLGLKDGLGVNVRFDSEADARIFMNEIYERVIVQIRQTDKYWRPGKG